jgi:mannose-6-phosphate isomerase-like protein (cupin superfamily)
MIARICTYGAVALAIAAAPLMMGSPKADSSVWRKSDLQRLEVKLTHQLDEEKSASETLGEYGNHHVEVAHREATGGAELHETQNDVFFILSGEATLIQGGVLVDPKLTEPHEYEAKSIQGGTKTRLAAGDVVHIPFKVPHQLVLEKGKQITYFVVKINAQ